MSGPVETRLIEKIQAALQPLHLEIENESHMHSVPKGSESHFRVVVVSDRFEGMSRIARQRLVHEILREEMAPGGIHALTQRTLTPQEWRLAGGATEFQSPECRGGSKFEKD